jgi:hypothetical protein
VGELPECRIDLNGKFACGAENQNLYCFGAGNGGESLNHRNRKRESLACASLRRRDDVAAFEEWRNGLRLDGRRDDEFVLNQVVLRILLKSITVLL